MKRTVTLFILLTILVGLFALPAVGRSAPGDPVSKNDTVDLLIRVDGSTDAMIDHITSIGGRVNFAYKNVPVMAVTIPAGKYSELVNHTDVKRTVKDRLVYLTDGPDLKTDVEPMSYVAQDTSGIEMKAIDPTTVDLDALPEGYANFLHTGALEIWEEAGYGDGTVVAVVDTGTARNVCLQHAVIGAPGFPDGYNATGDGIPATSDENHWHGTHVGGVIASSCALDFTGAENDPIYQAVSAYLPWEPGFVPIFGQAPEAEIYPVKVFPTDGSAVPTSIILDGLDHILTLQRDGLLDFDVVNMSLGGPTVFDGRDFFDLFLWQFRYENITVVTSAGNEGPIANSVGSPGTSYQSISVGALDYATSSRVLYEYLGLAYFPLEPGQGMVMRPTDETRVVNYSSRGPMSDGRFGPDISALGHWNFAAGPQNELRWAGGTSFSSPTVAGVVALLNSNFEMRKGRDATVWRLRNGIFLGADPDAVAPSWQDMNTMGYGALDAVAALAAFKSRRPILDYPYRTGQLDPNILGDPIKGETEVYESPEVTLNASETFDAVFEIGAKTSNVTIELFDITAPDNSAYAYWPNALEVHVQSAKRSGVLHPVELYWYPFAYGDSFAIEIKDGPWTVDGESWAYQPMEMGLMKVSLIGDYSNEAPVSFKMRVIRENFGLKRGKRIAADYIHKGDTFIIPVDIGSGVSTATFNLAWRRNWSRFPSSDIDMVIFDPDGNVASLDGATLNAPERAVIEDPAPGTWYVYIEGYEMYRKDYFRLFLKTK
jgi:subtilisin family serine protease